MRCDLHTHTTFSDGDRTPTEVVLLAEKAGVGVAITDHDECRGFGEIEGRSFGVPVYPGIELATRFGDEPVHVLGLGIDWHNAALLSHVERAADARLHRAERIVEKLRGCGVEIALWEVEYQGSVVGRAHIAEALVRKGAAADIRDAFARYLGRNAPCYVSYEKISTERAAHLISDAGGVAVVAHPGLMSPGAFDVLLPKLRGWGFWGVEAYYPSHTDGQCREFESLARAQGLCVTAGSDFHGGVKPDIALGQEKRGGAYLEKSMETFFAQHDKR